MCSVHSLTRILILCKYKCGIGRPVHCAGPAGNNYCSITATTVHNALVMFLPNILPNALRYLVASYILPQQVPAPSMRFELRHVHGTAANTSRIVFADVPPRSQFTHEMTYNIGTVPMKIHKARSQKDFFSVRSGQSIGSELMWDETDVIGPDVRDRETLRMLAKMTNNAYYNELGEKGWYDIGSDWNTACGFSFQQRDVLLTNLTELSVWLGARRRRF